MKDGKEISITYGDDNSINVNIFNNKILMGDSRVPLIAILKN